MRFYPDLYGRRFAWMLGDLVALIWTALWVDAGHIVERLFSRLDVLATGVINAGRTFDGWIRSFEKAVPSGVPYLSDFLRQVANALKTHSGDPLITAGQTGYQAIHTVALLLGVLTAAVPIAILLIVYLPRRIRLVYDMQGVHVTLRRALARPEVAPQMLEILAGRAIYTMPYHELLRYSHNPAEDWYARRFDRLAQAEMARHGLSVQRYFGDRPAA
ncbi:MAG TPA: hypothetical protein VET65_06970 [Candidatus Limnocylindrales bacterium]|nr:hypothetical protein [Candidatus Limnocylindrales bacterium]